MIVDADASRPFVNAEADWGRVVGKRTIGVLVVDTSFDGFDYRGFPAWLAGKAEGCRQSGSAPYPLVGYLLRYNRVEEIGLAIFGNRFDRKTLEVRGDLIPKPKYEGR